MDSSKVLIGDTAESFQYNDLRKDVLHAGYYNVENMDMDDSLSIEGDIVGDYAVVKYKPDAVSKGYFDVQIPPHIDLGLDWLVRIGFDMDTAEAAKNVRLQLQYTSVLNTGDTDPAKTTLLETVSTPNTGDTLKVITLSTIKIPNTALASGNEVSFMLSRLGSDGADTHGGFFRLFGLQLFQTQT